MELGVEDIRGSSGGRIGSGSGSGSDDHTRLDS